MVWDPLVRLIHWALALTILINGAIVDDESAIHEWIGYSAVALVCTRIIWGIIGTEHARFSAFPPNPIAALKHLKAIRKGDKTTHLSHNPLGTLMVYNIWMTIFALGVTGYMMGTLTYFGVSWVEEVHEIAFNWLLLSIILHIGGVIFETNRTGIPLATSMIDGIKHLPDDE